MANSTCGPRPHRTARQRRKARRAERKARLAKLALRLFQTRPTLKVGPDKSRDELTEIALGIYRGEIFTSDQLPETENLASHFLPIAFMNQEEREAFASYQPVLIYERMSEALRTGLNGKPCFTSFVALNRAETNLMYEILNNILATMSQFEPQGEHHDQPAETTAGDGEFSQADN